MVEDFLSLADEIIKRKLNELSAIYRFTGKEDGYRAVNELYLSVKFDRRMYAIATLGQIEDMWDYIRADTARLDFIMELTSELKFRGGDIIRSRVGGNDKKPGLGHLIDFIANAYGDAAPGDYSGMDPDTAKRLPERDVLVKILQSNEWLVSLYLINILPVTGENLNHASGRATAQSSSGTGLPA